jgi:hypothetical protein
MGKDPLNMTAQTVLSPVFAFIPCAQLDVVGWLLENTIPHPFLAHPCFDFFGVIGFVGVNFFRLGWGDPLKDRGVRRLGCGEDRRAD